jgi:hypothetical protein
MPSGVTLLSTRGDILKTKITNGLSIDTITRHREDQAYTPMSYLQNSIEYNLSYTANSCTDAKISPILYWMWRFSIMFARARPFLRQTDSIHILKTHFPNSHFNIIFLPMRRGLKIFLQLSDNIFCAHFTCLSRVPYVLLCSVKKVKLSLCHEDIWGSGDTAPPFLPSALDGGEWSVTRPCRFNPRKTAPVPTG